MNLTHEFGSTEKKSQMHAIHLMKLWNSGLLCEEILSCQSCLVRSHVQAKYIMILKNFLC